VHRSNVFMSASYKTCNEVVVVHVSGDGRAATSVFHVSNFALLRQYAAPGVAIQYELLIGGCWILDTTITLLFDSSNLRGSSRNCMEEGK
jgi:hypothetical protein